VPGGATDVKGAARSRLRRIDDTAARVGDRFPHWADPGTGTWTTTSDGDWTGGYWIGVLWVAASTPCACSTRVLPPVASPVDSRGDGA
jgi:unsaturated chondroitin disaccharide hydrolase